MLRKIAVGLCVVGGCCKPFISHSQADIIGREYNPIRIGAPFLSITPDSRSAGMGDQGVATRPDNYSQYWNAAKYPFNEAQMGASFTYTPWLKNLISGVSLNNLSGYYRIDQMQSVSASFRYFSLGSVEFKDDQNVLQKSFSPNEMALDFGYARKFSDMLASSVSFRYFSSNISGGYTQGAVETKAASSFAADIALYFQQELRSGYNNNEVAAGLSITNIGPKIAYSKDQGSKAFIPTTLRAGVRYSTEADRIHLFSFSAELSKLLVPTPKYDEAGANLNADKTVIESIFTSFADAPGGFSEELQEFTLSLGGEYTYNKMLSFRTGLFNESKNKGNRKFLSFGFGLNYSAFVLDFAYLVPTANGANSPLANTFRISIGTELGKDKYGSRGRSRHRRR